MAGYVNKVYVVQRADDELIAVKLTHLAAHKIAKDHAPAKVTCVIADKSTLRNVPAQISSQARCNQLHYTEADAIVTLLGQAALK